MVIHRNNDAHAARDVAQGQSAETAARIGVALHGAAADGMKARRIKRAVASEVIAELAVL